MVGDFQLLPLKYHILYLFGILRIRGVYCNCFQDVLSTPGWSQSGFRLFYTWGKSIKCIPCQKSFSHTGDLNIHGLSLTGVPDYECIPCKQIFSLTDGLKTYGSTI